MCAKSRALLAQPTPDTSWERKTMEPPPKERESDADAGRRAAARVRVRYTKVASQMIELDVSARGRSRRSAKHQFEDKKRLLTAFFFCSTQVVFQPVGEWRS